MHMIHTRWPRVAVLMLAIAVAGCDVDWLDVFDTQDNASDNIADIEDTDVPGLDVAVSDDRFARTYDNLDRAIERNDYLQTLPVDLADEASDVDQDIRPTRVILYEDPNRMIPIIAADRLAGLDLPPAVLVYQAGDDDDGDVVVATNSRDYLGARYDVADAADALDGLAADQADLVVDAAGNEVSRTGDVAAIDRHDGIADRTSDNDFDTTLDQLIDAINDDADLELLARFDHRAAAHRIGSMLDANDDPSTLVVFDAGAGPARAIAAGQTVAVDLPARILISRDTDGTVHVNYNKPAYLRDRHALGAGSAVADLGLNPDLGLGLGLGGTIRDLVDKAID